MQKKIDRMLSFSKAMLNGMKHKMTPLAAAASMPRNVMF